MTGLCFTFLMDKDQDKGGSRGRTCIGALRVSSGDLPGPLCLWGSLPASLPEFLCASSLSGSQSAGSPSCRSVSPNTASEFPGLCTHSHPFRCPPPTLPSALCTVYHCLPVNWPWHCRASLGFQSFLCRRAMHTLKGEDQSLIFVSQPFIGKNTRSFIIYK